jgi:hypothetical protein
MAMAGEEFLKIDFGSRGGMISFKTYEEIQGFVQQEQAHWNWLSQPPIGQHDTGQRAWNVIYQQFQTLQNAVAHWQNNPDYKPSVVSTFQNVFLDSNVPLSTSPLARFIEELRSRQGDMVAAAALATALRQAPFGNGQDWIRGGVELSAFEMGIRPAAAVATLKTLKKIEADMHTTLNAQNAAGEKERKTHEAQVQRQARRVEVLERWTMRRAARHGKALQAEVNEAIAELKETERLFKEQMRLKAPVEYWTAKATEHAGEAGRRLRNLAWVGSIAAIGVIGILSLAAYHAEKLITANTHLGVLGLYASIGLILTTVAFWIGRIMVRLYLSEHHLALDARERAVMAQTYLALTAVDKAEEKDRALVLGALFRASSDGIVKDDGAPDIGIAGIASKIVSR